jgi:ribonuclease J
MTDSVLRLKPLGGLGEVGMNCMLMECGSDAVIIDCGLMFPEEEVGVDVVHPLLDHLVENREKIRALLLTHGHEDHIGSVPFLLQYLNVPIYATDFTLRLVQDRLAEFELPWRPTFVSTSEGGPFSLGCFEVDTIQVNHSIPQATSLVLRSPAGTVVHTSDFKIGAPEDVDRFGEEAFSAVGREGVDLLLSDSTNIEKPGATGLESGVREAVSRLVREAQRGVFITLFPSNVRRMAGFVEIARENGRHVVLVGRSVERYAAAAAALSIIDLDDDIFLKPFEARRLPREQLMYVVAGTQGEPRSAMSKIARKDHRHARLYKDDTVIFSSRRIPGNEMRISAVIDDLARAGARIHHIDNCPSVHVSGHGHKQDLERMLELLSPRSFVPVHGNYHYLTQHAELARSTGVEDVLVVENGDVVEYSRSGLRHAGRCPSGKVHVDGSLSLSERILGERRQLADSGMVTAVLLLRAGSLERLDDPQILCRGVFDTARFPDLLDAARKVLVQAVDGTEREGEHAVDVIRKEGRRALKRFFSRAINRYPAITFIIVELLGEDVPARRAGAGNAP